MEVGTRLGEGIGGPRSGVDQGGRGQEGRMRGGKGEDAHGGGNKTRGG
jgi:hypothetical protein